MSRDIEKSKPYLSPASPAIKPSSRQEVPWGLEFHEDSPEFETQGRAIIARVQEFFEGVDITTPAPKEDMRRTQKGLMDIIVVDSPHFGYRMARAQVNGFAVAEMFLYDSSIGVSPYYKDWPMQTPKATYFLRGFTGHDRDYYAETFVNELPWGMELNLQLGSDSDYNGAREANHKTGITPDNHFLDRTHPKRKPLERPVEKSVLRELGVKL